MILILKLFQRFSNIKKIRDDIRNYDYRVKNKRSIKNFLNNLVDKEEEEDNDLNENSTISNDSNNNTNVNTNNNTAANAVTLANSHSTEANQIGGVEHLDDINVCKLKKTKYSLDSSSNRPR